MSFMLRAVLQTDNKMRKILAKDEADIVDKLIVQIERCARRELQRSDIFHVGLSGGSVLSFLCAAIPRLSPSVGLENWRFYFCDERYVDESDPDSTFGSYKTSLLPKTSLKIEQFVAINLTLPLEECAQDYERRIREDFKINEINANEIPEFDLLLLGMGPDGHTCSLFPGHALLYENQQLIAPISDSPKPPSKRITMTLPLLKKAKCCIFALSGTGKADIVKRILIDGEELPAGMVLPTQGELIWILDESAGKHVL